jgi:ribose transport system substrate-binding protein
LLCGAGLAACGSSSKDATDTEGAAATTAPATTAAAEQSVLDKLYAGDYVPAPTSGPKAVKGKNVWFVSCGQAFENCAKAAEAFKAAGGQLGWNVTVVDGAANPVKANDLIKQAVAGKVDGIASIGWDCPTIKAGLQAAKAADIPTVNFGGFDCDYAEFGGGQPLFTRTVNTRGGPSFENYISAYESARADALVEAIGGKGKIINLEETSLANQRLKAKKFKARIAEICPDCEIVPVQWQFAQVPAAATQIWKAALQKNPDATALATATDDIMGLGLATAIRQSGRHDLFVMGAESPPANLDLIKQGVQSAGLAIAPGYAWQMWAEADTLNRILAGDQDFPESGGGWALVDKDHLPADGKSIPLPDYQGAFEKIWAGQ